MDLILDHKKYRISSLEAGKHENQLFMSVRTRKLENGAVWVRHLLPKQLILEHLLRKTDFSVRIFQKKHKITFILPMYFISDHKKHRESSLEPGKHEKQLFISV